MMKPKVTIACPRCKTVKLIDYIPEKDTEKTEGCWACEESANCYEWLVAHIN